MFFSYFSDLKQELNVKNRNSLSHSSSIAEAAEKILNNNVENHHNHIDNNSIVLDGSNTTTSTALTPTQLQRSKLTQACSLPTTNGTTPNSLKRKILLAFAQTRRVFGKHNKSKDKFDKTND